MNSRPRLLYMVIVAVFLGTLLFSTGPTVYRREEKVAPKAATTLGLPIPNNEKKIAVDERGFWKGEDSVRLHAFDKKLAKALIAFFKTENVTTILELGAGMGKYARDIRAAGMAVSCYDGNPSTQNISEGRCAVADFSRPLDFFRHEWVLSLEVGEHIPAVYEDVFVSNLDLGNQNGLILSWGIEGQTGLRHVNNRNNSYIREKFEKLGYTSDFKEEKMLRDAAKRGWFKNTLMVFRKSKQ